WLRRQVDFIAAQRQAGRITFVHCLNGVSRSGLVVVAYLMQKNAWTREEALAFVQTRRPVRPNPCFMGLLLEWEQSLRRAEDGTNAQADRTRAGQAYAWGRHSCLPGRQECPPHGSRSKLALWQPSPGDE